MLFKQTTDGAAQAILFVAVNWSYLESKLILTCKYIVSISSLTVCYVIQMNPNHTTCESHKDLLLQYWDKGLTALKTTEHNVLAAEVCSQTGLTRKQLKVIIKNRHIL